MGACGLAIFGAERKPQPYGIPSQKRRRLKDLVRYRENLIAEKTRNKQHAQEFSDKLLNKLIKTQMAQLKQLEDAVDQEIKKIIAKDQQLKADMELVMTIPGVGEKTAEVLFAELGDLRKFPRANQLSAMAGLNPAQFTSGKYQGRTRMSKHGNVHVRSALYMLNGAVRVDEIC